MTTTPASDPEITPRRGDPTVAEARRDYYYSRLFEGWRIQIARTRQLKKEEGFSINGT